MSSLGIGGGVYDDRFELNAASAPAPGNDLIQHLSAWPLLHHGRSAPYAVAIERDPVRGAEKMFAVIKAHVTQCNCSTTTCSEKMRAVLDDIERRLASAKTKSSSV